MILGTAALPWTVSEFITRATQSMVWTLIRVWTLCLRANMCPQVSISVTHHEQAGTDIHWLYKDLLFLFVDMRTFLKVCQSVHRNMCIVHWQRARIPGRVIKTIIENHLCGSITIITDMWIIYTKQYNHKRVADLFDPLHSKGKMRDITMLSTTQTGGPGCQNYPV